MVRAFALLLLAASLATTSACSHAPMRAEALALATPALRLLPSALPQPLSLEQRLTFVHGNRRDTVDAMVESDADGTRLVIHAQGQVALRLDWDGKDLHQQRAPWLPTALDGERVLTDLQLVYWPLAAISAALPPGWTLADTDGRRMLRKDGALVATVEYQQSARARLQQHALGYTLDIESSEAVP